MTLKNILDFFTRTNYPEFTIWGFDYEKFFSMIEYYKDTNFFMTPKLTNDYYTKFSEYDIYIYINVIKYINTNYKHFKGNFKNIYKMITYSPLFIKNIPVYKNIVNNISNRINNLLNIIIFNFK